MKVSISLKDKELLRKAGGLESTVRGLYRKPLLWHVLHDKNHRHSLGLLGFGRAH